MPAHRTAIARPSALTRHRYNSRGALIRRVIIFQVKLFADGLRDVILSPISIAAAAIGIMFGGRNPHAVFDRLMEVGHESDRWIDLFGFHGREKRGGNLESMIGDIEDIVREDHARGGITADAQARLRDIAAELRRRASRR